MQDDSPRAIAGSRRVNKNASGSGQSKRAGQSQSRRSQQRQRHPPQLSSTSTSLLMQPIHDQQHTDHSMTSSVPPTPTYALPVYSDELGRLPLHGHTNFSAQPYLDQPNYWHQNIPNPGGTGGGSESNSDHLILPSSSSLSHHSNRRAQDHTRVQPSHSDESSYSNNATTEINTITQGFSLNPTIGTGNIMFGQPMPLPYIPPSSYAGVSPSMDIVSTQNPIRGRSSHPGFQGISMGDRGGAFGPRQESSQPPPHLEHPHHQHYHPHTQGQREQDIHNNLHHREQHQQQQQPMAYSYLDNDTIAVWSAAPTGFEYVFFFVGKWRYWFNIIYKIGWMSGARTWAIWTSWRKEHRLVVVGRWTYGNVNL